jgi:starch synthase (maltosyl-transferring)
MDRVSANPSSLVGYHLLITKSSSNLRIRQNKLFIEAEIFAAGQDVISAFLKHRHKDQHDWVEIPMIEIGDDRWRSSFRVERLGTYIYTLEAWINPFLTWHKKLQQKLRAGACLAHDLANMIRLLEKTARSASIVDSNRLQEFMTLCDSEAHISILLENSGLRDEINEVLTRYRDPATATQFEPEFRVVVDPVLARFGAWYEVFPRSCSQEVGCHGTLMDLADRLPLLANLGFDVVYIPPIHPIGHTARKGRNNSRLAQPGDLGSPWAVGAKEGGHKSIHPRLGTMDDFAVLLSRAQELGIQIAMDIALQCSPDHPYLDQHPEWFRRRADGSIQFAEDPPQSYEDIYPFDFECRDWRDLWAELGSIFTFWIDRGVTVFRVDNPHTKPLDFWEWLIDDLKSRAPNLIFLAEGLTRPSIMMQLARVGFSQSYDYFPWRNTKVEIASYYAFLTQSDVREFFRPNLWINTPQFLPEALQKGGASGIHEPIDSGCDTRSELRNLRPGLRGMSGGCASPGLYGIRRF